MKRESSLLLKSLSDASQPLLITTTITRTDNENEKNNVGLSNVNQMPDGSIRKKNTSHSTPHVILLSTFSGDREDLAESIEDDKDSQTNYQIIADNNYSDLTKFLEPLGITHHHLDQAQIPITTLLKLFQQELSSISWLKWSSLDHALEKNLQWLLLSPTDMGPGDQPEWDCRVRPHGRSILLKTTWGLMKAYAVRGFVQGLETGLLKSVHYFIYAMLIYRLEEFLKTGHTHFNDVQAIFKGASQKGIDSLVKSLAQLDAQWLKLILVAPLILGVLQGIWKILSTRSVGVEEIQKIADRINSHLTHRVSFWRDAILEEIPLLSNFLSLGNQVQKLEQRVRWDGRLDHQSRKQIFELIRRVALEGKRITQLNALESLAKIAHGIGFKDLPRLQRAGYSPEELMTLLYIKATALVDLETLSQQRSGKVFASYHRLYTSYLLWWLGLSTSWWTQRLPFALLKTVKLGLEVLFLQKIIASILEAIHCPDKPGFQFGTGYQDWASDYTSKCFSARIALFRSIYTNESVDDLIAEIPRYHLTDLIELDLSYMYLTSDEALQIIQAVVKQGASSLEILWLGPNKLTYLLKEMFISFSRLKFLDLARNQLTNLDEHAFSSLGRLEQLWLWNNQIVYISDGAFSNLHNLRELRLYNNFLRVLTQNIFLGLNQLRSLWLLNNQLDDIHPGVWENLPQLQTLWLSGNQINTSHLMSFLSVLPSNLITLDIARNFIEYLPENFTALLSKTVSSLTIGGDFVPEVLTSEFIQRYFPITYTGIGVSGSNVLSIANDTFSSYSSLTRINLSYNELTDESIYHEIFNQLNQLQSLDLAYNKLSRLNTNMFSNLNRLQRLNLSSNQLTDVGEGVFTHFNQLRVLDLTGNQLTNIASQAFFGLNKLETLFLQSNLLTHLSLESLVILPQLQWLYLQNNQLRMLSEGIFSTQKNLKGLLMQYNSLHDAAITNLTIGFPNQLLYLYLENNFIDNSGAQLLAKILPCTQIVSLTIGNNSINDSFLIQLLQQETLQKFCDDLRCHANLPASESCAVPTYPMTATRMIWGNAIEIDETASYGSESFYWPHATETSSFFSPILLSATNTSSLLTPLRASAALLGVLSLGLLLYKNSTWLQGLVSTSTHLFQRCWGDRKIGGPPPLPHLGVDLCSLSP